MIMIIDVHSGRNREFFYPSLCVIDQSDSGAEPLEDLNADSKARFFTSRVDGPS